MCGRVTIICITAQLCVKALFGYSFSISTKETSRVIIVDSEHAFGLDVFQIFDSEHAFGLDVFQISVVIK